MKLVKFQDYKLTITEEALLVRAFAVIWKRDRTREKDVALREFGVMYFLLDPRSDYMFITDEKDRLTSIKEQEGLPENWKPDEPLLEAMRVYKYLTNTPSSMLLDSSRMAVDKVRVFLEDLDLTLEDDKGKPKYTINSITSALKDIPNLVKNIREAEIAVNKDIEEVTKMRGQATKKLKEDGFNKV